MRMYLLTTGFILMPIITIDSNSSDKRKFQFVQVGNWTFKRIYEGDEMPEKFDKEKYNSVRKCPEQQQLQFVDDICQP